MSRKVTLLHVSDLHYGDKAAYQDDAKSVPSPAVRVSAFRNFGHLLRFGFEKTKPTAVIVSGDIATHGEASGFGTFVKHSGPLLRALVKDPSAICIVPGNHDVTWRLDTSLPDYFDQKFKHFLQAVDSIEATCALVPTGKLPEAGDVDIEFGNRVRGPLYIDQDNKLLIVCLNSSMRCGELNPLIRESLRSPITSSIGVLCDMKKKLHHDAVLPLSTALHYLESMLSRIDNQALFDVPHVTHAQLNAIREVLIAKRNELKDEWPSYTKVAVLHHHVVPFDYQRPEYKPFEVLLDSAAVLETLAAFGVQIVLTGHKHQPYVQQVRYSDAEMLIIGGATVGGYPIPRFGRRVSTVLRHRHQRI